MLKQIPEFKNEDEERNFWATHDSTEYLNWDQAEQLHRKTFTHLNHNPRNPEDTSIKLDAT